MTTAHRPTFDPARGKEAQRGPAFHQRLLPAHTQLKYRQAGQGGDADASTTDLAAELLQAEAAHFAKNGKTPMPIDDDDDEDMSEARGAKRPLPPATSNNAQDGSPDEEDYEAKRRRVLAETRDIDADDSSEADDDGDDSDSDSDSDDEDAELQRELERVRREREEKKKKEEEERLKAEEDERERHIALGNPLLNDKFDFGAGGKRRWDDDVVFKNQARGTEDKKKKEFVNDTLRSDFHRKFMSKYVR